MDIRKIDKASLIVMALMAGLTFLNLFGINVASAVIPLGVIFFFVSCGLKKQPLAGSALDIKATWTSLKDKKIWIWLVLPIVVDAVCVTLSVLFLPEYIEFETARAGSFVPIELSLVSTLSFFVFALGEEIAWRAFFQNRLSKAIPILPVLLGSSLIFALGHYKSGNPVLVIFGLTFTFINSVLYGVIFHKTKNAWVSAIAHFAANMFEVTLYVLLQSN